MDIKELLEGLVALEEYINAKVSKCVEREPHGDHHDESANTDKICAALGKAQGLFPKIAVNRSGHLMNSNFADMDIMSHAVRPALEANGLSVTHQIDSTEDGTMLTSKLRHASGQFIRSRIRILGSKSDVEFSESIKTMKRKAFESLLNITVSEDPEDNDSSEEAARNEKEMVKGGFKAPKKRYKTISKDLQRELKKELDYFPDLAEALFSELKIRSLAEIADEDYDGVITKVRKRKEARATGNYEGI